MNKVSYENIPKGDTSAFDEGGTYWILQEDQVLCLISPRRHDILDRLAAAHGHEPLSVRELAHDIGLKPPAVYHHLKQLIAAGLIKEAGSRVVNRRTEKLYSAIASRIRMAGALLRPELRDKAIQAGEALCRQMGRDFTCGLHKRNVITTGPKRNLGGFRLIGMPNKKTLEKVNIHLNEVARLLWEERDPNSPLLAFGWVMAPMKEKDEEED